MTVIVTGSVCPFASSVAWARVVAASTEVPSAFSLPDWET